MSSKSAMSTATEISSKKFNKEECGGMSHAVSMTISEIAQAAHLSYTDTTAITTTPAASTTDSSPASNAPRLNLRKRSVTEVDETSSVTMSSYDSAFLCGLFADIAETTPPSDSQSSGDSSPSESQDAPLNLPLFPSASNEEPPSKKSKINRNKSIARNGQSFFNLNSVGASNDDVSPVSPETGRDDIITTSTAPTRTATSQLAFPHLPATVSDQDLTRIDLHLPARQSTETYGWFVDMDSSSEEIVHETNAYAVKEDKQELAFNHPIAPVQDDMDAQVEWAKAADTVDDVLGDFF